MSRESDVRKGKEFSWKTKKEVKDAQKGRCALCGQIVPLQVHHCVPCSRDGTGDRTNAIALCERDHRRADTLTLKYGVPFEEIMEQGVWYYVKSPLYPKVR